jgi:hypothetical protein
VASGICFAHPNRYTRPRCGLLVLSMGGAMAKRGEVCERCGEAMSNRLFCPQCKMWLCRFCVTWTGKCPSCRGSVTR